MNKKYLILLILLMIRPVLVLSQTTIEAMYETSLSAIDAIRNNDIETFKGLWVEKIIKESDDEGLQILFNNAANILNKYDGLTPLESLHLGITHIIHDYKYAKLGTLVFTFPPTKKPQLLSDEHIVFGFSDEIEENKIVSFKVSDLIGPAKELAEQKGLMPHFEKFNFKFENLNWFRLWYDKGPVQNDLGNESGVYALKGNQNKLINNNADTIFSEILSLVNSAIIDSTDIYYSKVNIFGAPEYVFIRMKFDDLPYKECGEFRILTILTEENDFDEMYKDYIIIMHSDTNRYFLPIDKNKELWDKLKDLAHIDFGNSVEINP